MSRHCIFTNKKHKVTRALPPPPPPMYGPALRLTVGMYVCIWLQLILRSRMGKPARGRRMGHLYTSNILGHTKTQIRDFYAPSSYGSV